MDFLDSGKCKKKEIKGFSCLPLVAGDIRDMDIEKKGKKLIDTKLQDMKIEKMRQNARVTQENAVY